MGPKQQQWKYPGYAAQDRSGHYSGSGYSNSSGQAGQSERSGQDLPYGSYSFRRNDDPFVCTEEEQFLQSKIRLGLIKDNLFHTLRVNIPEKK